jgi:hypothetical protein
MNKNNLLFILFILIVLLLIKSPKDKFNAIPNKEIRKFSEQLYNGEQWNNYRIGDVIAMDPKTSKHYDPSFWENVLYHETMYPGTIAYEYMRLNKKNKKKQDLQLLNQIISSRKRSTFSNESTLYLHIRVGDVLCKKVWIDNAQKIYSKKGDTVWWDNIVRYINSNNITEVVIIAGTHFKECLEESANYILDRTLFLQNNANVSVRHRLGQSPDDDILFCQDAKHFISTGGEFGKLISLINKNNK